jgi:hypothetical protein
MLRVYAHNFIRVGARLERCGTDFRLVKTPEDPVTPAVMERFTDAMTTIRHDCREMGLLHTTEFVEHFDGEAKKHHLTYDEVREAVENVHRIYQSELGKRVFLYVPQDRAEFFEKPDLFGPRVSSAFTSCVQEIQDAGNCYALEQDTACVMHLMRTLESGLTVLGGEFGVNVAREQWHTIIKAIQIAVGQIGPNSGADWKERQEFYSTACQEFRYFKDAWRNHAMHVRKRYNGREAKRILDHTGDFMLTLSERLREPIQNVP